MALILLLGAALRFPLLDRVPYGIFYDEAINGLDALDVWRPGGTGFRIYYADAEGFPREPFFQTILAFTVRAFGNSVPALRATSAVIGLLTILLVYLFARRWLGGPEALAAAGVLATLRWHVIFSRLSFRTLVLGPFMLAIVWAVLAYRERPTAARAVLLGVLIGGGFYTYLSWWFLLPVVAGAVAWLFWRAIRTPQGRRHFALLALAALLTYLPMGIFFLRNPDIVLKRPSAAAATGASEILQNAGQALLMFHFWGDHVPVHNIPGPSPLQARILGLFMNEREIATVPIGRPALDPIQGILFLIGLAVAVRLWRRERGNARAHVIPLLFAWFVMGFLTTILTYTDSPNTLRTLCITPVLAILIGLALAAAGRAAARRWGAPIGIAIVAILLLGSAALTARDVYAVWPRHPAVWQRFHGDLTDLALTAASAPADTAVMFPARRFSHVNVRFLTDGHPNIHPYSNWTEMLGPWPPNAHAAAQPRPRRRWILLTGDEPFISALTAVAPAAQIIRTFPHPGFENRPWAALATIPEDELPELGTLETAQADINIK